MSKTRKTAGRPVTATASAAVAAALAALVAMFAFAGCTVTKQSAFVDASIDGQNVVIEKSSIGEQATFINYDANGTTVQLLAVQSTDGTPHVALNTCQSCNPSPKAFFQQEGEILTCNNCGLQFSVDTVGAVGASACNPTAIYGLEETEDAFIVPTEVLDLYAPAFSDWRGPTR